MVTIEMKLYSTHGNWPSGFVPITLEDCDVDWLKDKKITLGQNGHPSAEMFPGQPPYDFESLARQILNRHSVVTPTDWRVYRKDTDHPLDLTHQNLCVPPDLISRHLKDDGFRAINLIDYKKVFCLTRPAEPDADPVFVHVINMDTGKLTMLIADAEDAEWLEKTPMKFSKEHGYPLINTDWGKWSCLMFEQVRRSGLLEGLVEPVIHRLKPLEPLDVRKYYIGIVTKDAARTVG